VELLPLDWFSPFTTYMYVALFLGLTISSPIIIYEIYRFVNPALYDNERRLAFLFVGGFSALFLFGVAIGYMMLVLTSRCSHHIHAAELHTSPASSSRPRGMP
jgi:sec-independent protein translocase protein TatC